MSDPVSAIVAILKADSAVAALAETRIHGEELPQAVADAMPKKGVVIRSAGGFSPARGTLRHTGGRIDAICWGETPYEANRMNRAVFDCLKTVRRQRVALDAGAMLIHWIEDASSPFSLRDQDTNWPAVTQSFQIFHAMDEAA
ncbi:MAG: DUF3168 domain-containing protein [Nitratireductor sp.]